MQTRSSDSSPLTPLEALTEAIRIAGSQAALARLCGVSQPSVFRWINRRQRVPPTVVLAVEAKTGISRHDLRPDIYPRDGASNGSGVAAGDDDVGCDRSGVLHQLPARKASVANDNCCCRCHRRPPVT